MLTQVSQNQTFTTELKPTQAYRRSVPAVATSNVSRLAFLQSVLEGFVDGLLILSEQGEVLHANSRAHRICRQFSQAELSTQHLPEPMWRVCQTLLESRKAFPDQKVIPETEISLDEKTTIRIRAQWIELAQLQQSCLLVTLENRSQSMQNLAIADARKYGFTPRETEVWALRRAGHSYKDIARKLYITHNTVKRHIKNILAKQQDQDLDLL